MNVVLDTNILVSGLLSSSQAPGQILDLVLAGEINPVIDKRILAEYREVLARPKFSFDSHAVGDLLAYIERTGMAVSASPWDLSLPDPDDAIFLEVAAVAQAPLITGNLRHYPPEKRQDIVVMSPRDFVEWWQQQEK